MNKDDPLCSNIQQLCRNFDSRIVVIPPFRYSIILLYLGRLGSAWKYLHLF